MLMDAEVDRLGTLLRSDRFSRAKLTDRTGVMVDAAGMKMLSLNETGMFLVEELVSGRSPEGLVDRLVKEFRVNRADARRDLEKFLDELDRFLSTS